VVLAATEEVEGRCHETHSTAFCLQPGLTGVELLASDLRESVDLALTQVQQTRPG
jgi:hypothetical protein